MSKDSVDARHVSITKDGARICRQVQRCNLTAKQQRKRENTGNGGRKKDLIETERYVKIR